MKILKHSFLLFLISLYLGSCTGFFDSEIELPTPDHDPVLAVSSFITSSDTSQVVARVTRTYGLFEDRPNNDLLYGATVKLFENGELLFEFDTLNLGTVNYGANFIGAFGGFGNTYTLEVSHPEWGTATAEQTMPEPVPLQEFEFRELPPNIFSGTTGELSLTFQDPPGEENYYELVVEEVCTYTFIDYYGQEVTEEYRGPVFFETEFTNDPNISRGYNFEGLLVSDRNFDGQTFTLKPRFLYCLPEDGTVDPSEQFIIHWRTVTKDYFNYSISLNDNLNAQNNPFAEPVSLYNNVENGVGAFCLRAELIY
jgi:hypothetical protein